MAEKTIIAASLDDSELKKSIDGLVSYYEKSLGKMGKATDEAILGLQTKLAKLGTTKIDSSGSSDGGSSKRASSLKNEKKSVDETKMSYDNLVGALQYAQREVKKWEGRKVFSTGDLDNYQAALARVVEYEERVRQARGGEIYKQFDDLSKRSEFDAKADMKSLFAVDERLKQLNRYYATLEKESDRAIAKEEKLASIKDKNTAKLQFSEAQKLMPTENYDQTIAKIERMREILAVIREKGFFTPNQLVSAEASIEKFVNLAQQQKVVEQGITDEIKQQAAEIRKSKEFRETGYYRYQDVRTPNTDYVVSANPAVSIEGQLLENQRLVSRELQIQAENEAKIQEVTAATAANKKQQLDTDEKRYAFTNKEMQDLHEKRYEESKRATIEKPAAKPSDFSDLEYAIAQLLNVEVEELNLAQNLKSSYVALSGSLSQMTKAYQEMTDSERKSKQGTELADRIQKTSRAISEIQKTMTRPVSLKAAMGLSEKTMDDITYKIQQLRAYKGGLDLTNPKQVGEISQVDAEIKKLNNTLNKYMVDTKHVTDANTALGRSWNYMKNRLAFYFTVGASTAFVKNLIEVRGQYELLERSIGILIDSAQRGSQIFAELNAMAIKSPFTTMELGAAAKQLVAYDVAAKDVVDTTRRLADMAAAVGIPIERLTYALGQIKSYGYLNSRDARMFSNAGIPLVKQLADYYTELEGRMVSVGDVYDRIKKKTVDYTDVVQVVNNMTDEGGKFFNFQEKAADTLKVKIANLTLAWNNMLNEIGKDSNGILAGGLGAAKQLFEHWRDINNMILSAVVSIGALKAATLAYLMITAKTLTVVRALAILQEVIGKKATLTLVSLAKSFASLANPMTLLTITMTAFSIAIGKAVYDYYDLVKANEAFNQSVSASADENIKSIDKFFDDYKKQFANLESLNKADLTKLWERLQEEIEKTTKNAEAYVDVLNKITDVSERIELGKGILDQSQRIQEELKRLADRGAFSLGGGFADDNAAKNLQEYQETLNEINKEYGSVDKAIEAHSAKSRKLMADYSHIREETEKEMTNLVSQLDNLNMAEILGDSGDTEIQLANIRATAELFRDNFLATEQGSKIGADGIARLNAVLDQWITKQAEAHWLIQDANGLFDAQRAKIEGNRTAWEEFFRYLTREERNTIDAAIKTNQLGGDEVKKIWDNVAERMAEKSFTSYEMIQQQIAELRNTPDIVINVVYRNNKEKLEKDQEEFEKKFIQPQNWGALSTDEYLKQEKANREKYGTLMRKQGEDTADYEKRISDERKSQLELQKKNGDIIEENKNKTDDFSRAVTEQAKKEKQAADDRLKVIKEVEDAGGYDFSTKSERAAANKAAKQAESELQKALKDELSTIDKVRSIYKDLTKEGMSHADAVERATKGWDETVNAINKVLQKNGLQKLDLTKFAGVANPRGLVNMLQSQLNILVGRGVKPAEIKELQTKIQTLKVDADKYDMTMITKGLNSELSKLKDEYELAVELDANPELGNMFADMFGIDTKALPHTFGEAYEKALEIAKNKLREAKLNVADFDLMSANFAPDKDGKWQGVDVNSDLVKGLISLQKTWRDVFKKNLVDTENALDEYVKKYGDYSDKVAEIEAKKLERIKRLNDAYYTEEMRQSSEYQTKLNAINKGAEREESTARFDQFKESRYYTMMFENLDYISTKTIRDMRDRIRQLIDTTNKLTPEQLKHFLAQYEKLEQKLAKRSPFKTLGKDLKAYLKTMGERKTANKEFRDAQKLYDAQMLVVAALEEKKKQQEANVNTLPISLDWTETELKAQKDILEILKEQLDAAEKKASKYNLMAKLAKSEALEAAQVVAANLQGFGELRDFIQGDLGIELSDELNGLIDGLQGVGNGINSIISSAQSGNVTGVVAGVGKTIYGLYDGIASIFGGGSAKDKKITRQVEESVREVKRLENIVSTLKNAYDMLSNSAERAYGTQKVGADMALQSSQKMQLQMYQMQKLEVQRQLQLERSRSSKKRDEDRIIDLQGQLISLQSTINGLVNDVANAVMDITDELLGLSRSSWAEDLTGALIDAFKKGEDYMDVFEESWDDMVEHLIIKMISARLIGDYMDKYVFGRIDDIVQRRTQKESDNLARQQKAIADWQTMDTQAMMETAKANKNDSIIQQAAQIAFGDVWEKALGSSTWTEKGGAAFRESITKLYSDGAKWLQDELTAASAQATKDAYEEVFRDPNTKEGAKSLIEGLPQWLEDVGIKFGQDAESGLSSLQAGIQGITETTAGALEAITTGMYQQVTQQTTILTQIQATIDGFDLDASLGVQSQMLLQLQNNYIIMQSMHAMMEGWTTPSGQGIRVQMI